MNYHQILPGSTSKIIEVVVRNVNGEGMTGLTHSDVTASYLREGGTRQNIPLSAGTAGDSYSSGKWAEVDSTNMKGVYQLHIPNDALLSGASSVLISLQATNAIPFHMRIPIETALTQNIDGTTNGKKILEVLLSMASGKVSKTESGNETTLIFYNRSNQESFRVTYFTASGVRSNNGTLS